MEDIFGTVGPSNLRFTQGESTNLLREYVRNTILNGNETEELRITNYELYWQFYIGNHWRQYNRTMMSFNYVRAFVNKVCQFLIGNNGFTLRAKGYGNITINDVQEKTIESFLMYHFERNKYKTLIYELLQMGSVMGDAWTILTWDVKKKMVVIKLADSRQVFPKFRDGNVDDVEAVTIRQPLTNHPDKFVLFVTEYKADVVTQWYQKTTGVTVADKDKYRVTPTPNPLGFIPVVHFKNRPVSTGYYSTSDVEDVLKLNKTYNELSQELKSIIDYHTAPTTVVTGANVSNLTKKLGRVWSGFPAEAQVFNLGLDADLSAAQEFMGMIKTAMHEMADVPENYLGKIQSISNTSAAALQLTYQPLVQAADMKWLMYGEGLTELCNMMYGIVKTYDPENKRLLEIDSQLNGSEFGIDLYAEPVFTYGFPQDRQVILAQAESELRLRLNTRRNILNNMGTRNTQELLEEIRADVLNNAELDRETTLIVNPPPPVIVDPAAANGATPPQDAPPLVTPQDFLG